MLIEEVDGFDLQTPKGVLRDNFDVLGTTIECQPVRRSWGQA